MSFKTNNDNPDLTMFQGSGRDIIVKFSKVDGKIVVEGLKLRTDDENIEEFERLLEIISL